jgi:hypothetical protein
VDKLSSVNLEVRYSWPNHILGLYPEATGQSSRKSSKSRFGSCAEKAAGFHLNPPRLNIANSTMFLVFSFFLIAQAPEKILCRGGDRTSSPEQLALDCSKGHAFLGQPLLVSCHILIRKWQERVLGNVKSSDYPTIWQMDSLRTSWNPDSNRESQRFIATDGRDHRCRLQVRVRSSTTNKSDAIAGTFMPIFEGELGDPRFIELAQALLHHAVVLFLGRTREW